MERKLELGRLRHGVARNLRQMEFGTGRDTPGMTPLQKTIKRLLTINGRDYVVAVAPDGLKLTLKGKRKGIELEWEALVSGEAALAAALQASVGQFEPSGTQPPSR